MRANAFFSWLKQAIAAVYATDGLRGVIIVAVLLFAILSGIVALLTLTPLGAWLAAWLVL